MSKRENRKAWHSSMEKETRRLINRARLLDKIIGLKEKEKLDKPLFYGWKREFVVKSHLRLSYKFNFYKELLEYINVTWYSNDKNFNNTRRRSYYFWDKNNIQELKEIYEDKFLSLNENQQKYFDRKENYNKWTGDVYYTYKCNKPSLFRLKISPHYIEEVSVIYPEVVSELALINYKLYDKKMELKHGPDFDYKRGGYWREKYHRPNIKKIEMEMIDKYWKE